MAQRGIGAFMTGPNTEKYIEELRKRPGRPRKRPLKSSIIKLNDAVDAGGASRPSSAVNVQMPGQHDALDQQIHLAGDINSPPLAAEKRRLSLEEEEQEGTASHGPTPRGRSCRARGVSDGSWRDNRTLCKALQFWNAASVRGHYVHE